MPHDITFSPLCNELAAKAREIAEKHVRPSAAKYDRAQECPCRNRRRQCQAKFLER